MAGNIVKWWKHKILGGYKQFSVLQECATDSEELIYPIRAPSTCSAPPDLLLTNDREPIGSKMPHSVPKDVKITTTTKSVDGVGTEKMLLEEFTCDVSVEGGKSSQPLQFSFTFYDLDGHHHGKITKDDIAGIVYTIYESIGKSVVVPHCGSKTINVRLTVSPDAKSKAKKSTAITPRKHRYRPKKLIPSEDEEDSESASQDNCQQQKDQRVPPTINAIPSLPSTKQERKCNLFISENQVDSNRSTKDFSNKETAAAIEQRLPSCCTELKTPPQHEIKKSSEYHNSTPKTIRNNCGQENVYESISNFKCCPKNNVRIVENKNEVIACRECTLQCPLVDVSLPIQPGVKKLNRKSRSKKQKQHATCRDRVRSLSVGNENCYLNGSNGNSGEGGEECLNNLRRNDLIDIIRESMEKNRLCFQSNGKTTENQARHRHRSHTISKFVGEQSNLNYSNARTPPTNNNHSKANRCGYDSFLHATICSNNVTSSNFPAALNTPKLLQNQNNRAIRDRHKSNEIPLTASPQVQGYTKLNSMHTKLNTTMLSQLNPQLTPEQKLSRTINHVEKWLTERDQVLTKTNDLKMIKFSEDLKNKTKDLAKDEKNIDNLINAKVFVDKLKMTEKFTEKCIETPKKTFNKETLLTRKLSKGQRNVHTNQNIADSIKAKGSVMEYASIPINVDPIECENLLRASSDDSSQTKETSSTVHRYVHEHIHHHYHHFESAGEL